MAPRPRKKSLASSFFCFMENISYILIKEGSKMNRKEIKAEIKGLKKGLKQADRAKNARLFKFALVMVILAVVAAFVYGRIHL
jgi:t-SNARE complex subunit (syntaxin)